MQILHSSFERFSRPSRRPSVSTVIQPRAYVRSRREQIPEYTVRFVTQSSFYFKGVASACELDHSLTIFDPSSHARAIGDAALDAPVRV